MPIFLSATAIQDFIDCPQRFAYRTTQKEQSITSDDMLVGTIVHAAIEKFWNDKDLAVKEVGDQTKFFSLNPSMTDKALLCIHTFFESFAGLLSKDDEIEYTFKLQLEKDVFLVGRMDRISNGNIFDWKTKNSTPKDISKDIQFIVYSEAYRRLFKKEPIATYYASLTTGKLLKLKSNPALTNTLFNAIIPVIAQAIKQKLYYPKGIYTNNCHMCPYKELCYKDLGYVQDSIRNI
jgi:CRISPR/Cas system-associated exonuclease Cas4 (RecB family)